MTSAQTTSAAGRQFIESFEGLILGAYDDANDHIVAPGQSVRGTLTIGYGHTTAAGAPKVYAGQTITNTEADQILAADLAHVEKEVLDLVKVPLTQNQFDALVSFHFNTGGLGRSSTLTEINKGNYTAAANGLLLWNRGNGQILQGLVRRRAAEKVMFLKPDGVPAPAPPPVPAPIPAPQPVAPAQAPLLERVIAGMEAKGYRIDKGPGEINIAYAEGHDRDGTRNDNKPGYWNDVRMVFTYVVGLPALKGAWTATTQPGPYYTENRLNPLGAANIKPGQYTAWRVGLHRGQYEALVQRGTITLTRDDNEDYSRVGDAEETGSYEGVNQHHGSNAETVGPHSAGCLVAKMVDGHIAFMEICKSDPRYISDHSFLFTTTVLAISDID